MIMPVLPSVEHQPQPDFLVDWEETPCLLCGRPEHSPLVEAPDAIPGGTGFWFAVVQCQKCGFCFTNPRPRAASIHRFYPPSYRPHRTPTLKERLARRADKVHAARRWGKADKVIAPIGKGRLLDFGCGGGVFLERMHRQGWQVTGLDVSEETVKRIRAGLGLTAYVGTLPCPELAAESFDLITMWQTLEHVHEPLEVVRDAYRLLSPGGKLIVAVPNIDSLPFRLFGHAWFGLDLPRHLSHFTPPTLQAMLERAGFSVRPIEMIRHSGWVRASASLAVRLKSERRWHRLLRTKSVSRILGWYSFVTGQTDCLLATAFKPAQATPIAD